MDSGTLFEDGENMCDLKIPSCLRLSSNLRDKLQKKNVKYPAL